MTLQINLKPKIKTHQCKAAFSVEIQYERFDLSQMVLIMFKCREGCHFFHDKCVFYLVTTITTKQEQESMEEDKGVTEAIEQLYLVAEKSVIGIFKTNFFAYFNSTVSHRRQYGVLRWRKYILPSLT